MLSKEISSIIFKSLVLLDLGLNPGLPGHWRTLYPLGQCVHKRMSFISSSLLLQLCPACLVRLGWFVRWETSGRTAGVFFVSLKDTSSRICSKQDIASLCSSYIVFLTEYSCTRTATAWKKSNFILSGRSFSFSAIKKKARKSWYHICICIYPTPPHKQDVTLGRFFMQRLVGLNPGLSFS